MATAAPTVPPTESMTHQYPDLNESHPEMYLPGIAVAALSCGAFAIPLVTTFPLAGAIQIVALGILSAIGYGIANDQLACRQCAHYFTVGHTRFHRRLLATENPTINGIVWGIYATWKEGLIAGVVMAIAARATKLVALSALQLAPWTIAISLGVCLFSHYRATQKEAEWKDPERREILNRRFQVTIHPENGYHPVDLRRVPEQQQAAYLGVGARNEASYMLMPISGLLLAVGTVAVRIFSTLF